MTIGIVRGYKNAYGTARNRDHIFTIVTDGEKYDLAYPNEMDSLPLIGTERFENLIKFSPIRIKTPEDMLTVLTRSLESVYVLKYEFETDYKTIEAAIKAETEKVEHCYDYRTGRVDSFNNDEEGIE